MYRRKTEGQKA